MCFPIDSVLIPLAGYSLAKEASKEDHYTLSKGLINVKEEIRVLNVTYLLSRPSFSVVISFLTY